MNAVVWVAENPNRHIDDRRRDNSVSGGVGECERVHLLRLLK